jgi:hypothetical protein
MSLKEINRQLLIYGSAFALISCVLLFMAVADNEYGYYQFLRITVSLTAIIVLITAALHREPLIAVPSFFALLLFNPVFSFAFEKSTWQILDLVFGAYFLGVGLAFPYEYYKNRK